MYDSGAPAAAAAIAADRAKGFDPPLSLRWVFFFLSIYLGLNIFPLVF